MQSTRFLSKPKMLHSILRGRSIHRVHRRLSTAVKRDTSNRAQLDRDYLPLRLAGYFGADAQAIRDSEHVLRGVMLVSQSRNTLRHHSLEDNFNNRYVVVCFWLISIGLIYRLWQVLTLVGSMLLLSLSINTLLTHISNTYIDNP